MLNRCRALGNENQIGMLFHFGTEKRRIWNKEAEETAGNSFVLSENCEYLAV